MVEVIACDERDGRQVFHDLRYGVYAVFEGPTDYARLCFQQYGVTTDSTGRYAALYRPFHLIGLELNVSILNAALRGEPTGTPMAFNADVMTTAKRDLAVGDVLDGEGGYCVYGKIAPAAASLGWGALPLGLAQGVRLKAPVAAGEISALARCRDRYDRRDRPGAPHHGAAFRASVTRAILVHRWLSQKTGEGSRMETIDVNTDALEAMADGDPEEPVVMLNLLRYRDQARSGHGVGRPERSGSLRGIRTAFREACIRDLAVNPSGWVGPADRSSAARNGMSSCWFAIPPGDSSSRCSTTPYIRRLRRFAPRALVDSRLVETTQLLPRA